MVRGVRGGAMANDRARGSAIRAKTNAHGGVEKKRRWSLERSILPCWQFAEKHSLTVTACSDLGILARNIRSGARREPLSEMTVDFVDALPELVIRHPAERGEVGRVASAIEKFACQLLRM